MRITVLFGGPSSEREVSLVSGKAVADGLRQAGHDVFTSDVSPENLTSLDRPCDIVFPVLHGAFGEDGTLQAILEARKIPFVGSGSAASKIAIDKVATKRVWANKGIPTPAFHVATTSDATLGSVRAPCVVKSIRGGSSIGVFVCAGEAEALEHIRDIVAAEGEAMIEQFVKGPELTVGILEEHALPPIRIVYEQGFFDYRAKYAAAGGAKHDFETGQPAELVAEIQRTVEKAHGALGCRDLSRTDVMIDSITGKFYLLEINTLPGFTPRSLLPEAAAKTGVPFPALVDRLARRAQARGAVV